MDTIFKDIKIFYSSVRDTVLQFNDDEIINKCMEIDELINMCSSYTMRGEIIPHKLFVEYTLGTNSNAGGKVT